MKRFIFHLLVFVTRHANDRDFIHIQLMHLTAAMNAHNMRATCGSEGRLHDDILETWIAVKAMPRRHYPDAMGAVHGYLRTLETLPALPDIYGDSEAQDIAERNAEANETAKKRLKEIHKEQDAQPTDIIAGDFIDPRNQQADDEGYRNGPDDAWMETPEGD